MKSVQILQVRLNAMRKLKLVCQSALLHLLDTFRSWIEPKPTLPIIEVLSKIREEKEEWSPFLPRLCRGKPLKEHSILLWDYENIDIHHIDAIMRLAKYTPHKRYMVTKKSIPKTKQALIEAMGFTILGRKPYEGSADDKIINLIQIHALYPYLMLISSDSDFVASVHRHLKKGCVQWIMQDCNKKRILMLVNLTHPRLILSTF